MTDEEGSARAHRLAERVASLSQREERQETRSALLELHTLLLHIPGGGPSVGIATTGESEADSLSATLDEARSTVEKWEQKFERTGYPTTLVIDGWNVLVRGGMNAANEGAALLVGMCASLRARLGATALCLFDSATHQSWGERYDGIYVGRLNTPEMEATVSQHLAALEGERVLVLSADREIGAMAERHASESKDVGVASDRDTGDFYAYLSALSWLDVQDSSVGAALDTRVDEQTAHEFWFGGAASQNIGILLASPAAGAGKCVTDSSAAALGADADVTGFDSFGYDTEGYDRKGYDRKGCDRERYDRFGRDRDGYDRFGYDTDGRDRNGRQRSLPRGARTITEELKSIWLSD